MMHHFAKHGLPSPPVPKKIRMQKENDSAVSLMLWKNATASDTAVTSQDATTNQKYIALLLTQQ